MNDLERYITPSTHGYLVEGTWEHLAGALERAARERLGVRLSGNPNALSVRADTIGIDDARAAMVFQSRRAFGDASDRKVITLACRSVTTEAQNALLKVLEEPTPGTYFFIVVPSARTLLPTLRSRLLTLSGGSGAPTAGDASISAAMFLAAPPAERLRLLETIIKDRDRAAAHSFLDSLLVALYGTASLTEGSAAGALAEIIRARSYLADRGASVKVLLEHLALVVPRS